MKCKKIIAVLLAIVLLMAYVPIGAIPVAAANNGVITYEIIDGEVTITGFVKDKPVHLEIPDTIEGYPVTAIASNAFNTCKTLVSVTIPDSVTTLGNHVFMTCPNLETAVIGDGVTVIPRGMFWYCQNLRTVHLGDNVTHVEDNTFMGCYNLSTMYVGAALKRVTSLAFDTNVPLTVYYAGSHADYLEINFGYLNDCFENADWHYNVCFHEYDDDHDTDCNDCGEVREVAAVAFGDLTGDAEINNRDLVALQQFLNSWEIVVDEDAADVNGDGEINNRDLVLLQQYLNGWDVTLGPDDSEVSGDDSIFNDTELQWP